MKRLVYTPFLFRPTLVMHPICVNHRLTPADQGDAVDDANNGDPLIEEIRTRIHSRRRSGGVRICSYYVLLRLKPKQYQMGENLTERSTESDLHSGVDPQLVSLCPLESHDRSLIGGR